MLKMTRAYAAEKFLEEYIKEKGILHISELFSKNTLIENTFDSDWEQYVIDEVKYTQCSKDEAQKKILDWYFTKTNIELWVDHISDGNKNYLIENKADELGFKYEIFIEER